MLDPTSQVQEWFEENSGRLMIAAAAIFLAGALAYGVLYYKKTSLANAQNRLFTAIGPALTLEPTPSVRKEAIEDLNGMIEAGGPSKVIGQARIQLAALYDDAKEYEMATEQYRLAAGGFEPDSILREISVAGEASSLTRAKRASEAGPKLAKLADSAKFYPRAEALLNHAYILASENKTQQAVEVLKRLQSKSPSYLPPEMLNGIMRRIEQGELYRAMSQLDRLSAEPAVHQKTTGQIGVEKVN